MNKYKERLVSKGFSKKEGIDYEETFALETKWNIIRIKIKLVVQHGWTLQKMDVKSTFLNGDLK